MRGERPQSGRRRKMRACVPGRRFFPSTWDGGQGGGQDGKDPKKKGLFAAAHRQICGIMVLKQVGHRPSAEGGRSGCARALWQPVRLPIVTVERPGCPVHAGRHTPLPDSRFLAAARGLLRFCRSASEGGGGPKRWKGLARRRRPPRLRFSLPKRRPHRRGTRAGAAGGARSGL